MIEIVSEPGAAHEVAVTADGGPTAAGALPVLPLREVVPVPDTMLPLAVGQERSVKLIDDVLAGERRLVMVAARDPELEAPGPDQVHAVGVVGQIVRMLKIPDGSLRLLVQGSQRVQLTAFVQTDPYLVAEVQELPDVVAGAAEENGGAPTAELTALQRNVQETFSKIVEALPYLPEELQLAVANIDDPVALSHLIAGSLRLPTEEKQELLEEVDVQVRLRRLMAILARELEVISIGSEIQSQVQSELDKGQREYVLRQQLKAIQEELGESDPLEAELADLREQLDAAGLPEVVGQQTARELRRLESIPQASAEHGVIRTYLEWMVSLPWTDRTTDDLDLQHARQVLDDDHHGLDDVKDRILEFLAVRQLKPDARGSILCLVGPPGVGKTSLGRSIARAMGRKFERVSAGGVRDEAEIRGHRRTYIGAMPGTIIRALRDAGSNNPLLMIDEIDKMGSDFRGSTSGPESAMLEVLDPEQNSTFRDHYLDVPFDLSRTMFITTANTLDTVPGPLRDRMEVLQLAGYTAQEKLEIAKRFLVPRQLERHGLRKSWVRFGDPALRTLIEDYTRESGVRNLEREIGRVTRKIARRIVEGERADGAAEALPKRLTVTPERVEELLGRGPFSGSFQQLHKRTRSPGVATGLAWTPVGGDVLFVEAAAMPRAGNTPTLRTTGQLGDVMTESVQAAVTWVRGHLHVIAPELPDTWFADYDLHVHVPAGATPKDGPSAGITIATAVASLLSGREVRSDVAMTGEITLTGEVLPIGGLKEKALAAQRNGVSTVIAPHENERDAEDVPEPLRSRIEFVWVDRVEEALRTAIPGLLTPSAG